MTQTQFLTDWAVWLSGVFFWICVVFTPAVSLIWKWWRDEWGINIVTFEAALGLTLLRPILITEFGLDRRSISTFWIQNVALTLALTILVWRFVLIFHGQIKGNRMRANGAHAKPSEPTK